MIETILKNRVLVLDGAMGTMLQKLDFNEEDFRGERFKDHPCPLGATMICYHLHKRPRYKKFMNSISWQGQTLLKPIPFLPPRLRWQIIKWRIWPTSSTLSPRGLQKESAKKITTLDPNKPRFVAGAIGPTNKTASMSPDVKAPGFRAVDFDALSDANQEQVSGLIAGGVDVLLVETIFDTLNAKAALGAIQQHFFTHKLSIPVMVSGTITDNSGRTLSGQTVEAFAISLSHIPLMSIGFNCALGAGQLHPYVERMAKFSNFYTPFTPMLDCPMHLVSMTRVHKRWQH